MEDLSFDLPLVTLPFQVLEYEDSVVLKRGLQTLIISGSFALQRVLLIMTLTAEKPLSGSELMSHFPSGHQQDIEILIRSLFSKRLIVYAEDSNSKGSDPIDIFYDEFGLEGSRIYSTLSKLHIILCGINSINEGIFSGLNRSGVRNISFYDDPLLRNFNYLNSRGDHGRLMTSEISERIIGNLEFETKIKDNQTSLLVGSSDFGGQSLLLKWNRFSLEKKIHFYPVYLQGISAYSGPLVIPGETPCLDCVRHRQNAHLKDLEIRNLLEQNSTNGQVVSAYHPSIIGVVSNIAIFELIQFYGNFPQSRPEKILKVNLPESSVESKRALKIPRCPTCSNYHLKSEVQVRKMTPMKKA